MRRLWAVGVAASALLVVTSGASATRLGPQLGEYFPSALASCPADPFCTRAQVKVRGERMAAPFTGRIRKWRVTQPNGTIWLQVLHKRDDGTYKALRHGDFHTVTSGVGEVISFAENLRIRRGDFIAVGEEDFGASSIGLDDSAASGNCTKGFVPGLDDGGSASPNPSYSSCGNVLLYNATLRH